MKKIISMFKILILFLRKYEEKKIHNMLSLNFNPGFKFLLKILKI